MTDRRAANPVIVTALQMLQQGRSAEALGMLRAAQGGSRDPEIPMHIAVVLRSQGNLQGALASLDEALALDPYHFVALLSKGGVLEQMGRNTEAARVYGNALKIAPPADRLPPSLAGALAKAQAMVKRRQDQLAAHLHKATAGSIERAGSSRAAEAVDILAGTRKAFVQEPLLLNFPQLPAIPFFDRSYFPWLERLEAATDQIRAELLTLLRDDQDRFHPYIQFPPGVPVNQWIDLNHSPSWSTMHMWRDGRRDEANCARCPFTADLLAQLPMADQDGYAPTANFSILAPHAHIPPHTGSSNTRLIVHLPLIVPENCLYRVGNDSRPWTVGEAWVFDDTIEHEARNDSDELRAILMFDVWNPLLSTGEREVVTAMLKALKDYDKG